MTQVAYKSSVAPLRRGQSAVCKEPYARVTAITIPAGDGHLTRTTT